MRKHRRYSIEFKRQVVADYLAGESASALARRHDLSRHLVRVWVEKAEAGELDQDVAAADLLVAYEAKIAALERLVGQQTLEIEFLKKAQKLARSRTSAASSASIVPPGSPSVGGAR
jgi:transposase-like protein